MFLVQKSLKIMIFFRFFFVTTKMYSVHLPSGVRILRLPVRLVFKSTVDSCAQTTAKCITITLNGFLSDAFRRPYTLRQELSFCTHRDRGTKSASTCWCCVLLPGIWLFASKTIVVLLYRVRVYCVYLSGLDDTPIIISLYDPIR